MKYYLRIFFFSVCLLYNPLLLSEGRNNLRDISINSNTVTLNERNNNILFEGSIEINFGSFIIFGNNALLSYENETLTLNGDPASITSELKKINGEAKKFIIHPNQSLEMIGNATLNNKNQSISAELITYQIDQNG
jgi:lipopolysaccharide transport protein LptA